jgi:co-chaperonin GroES (HSP10)
MLKLQPVGHRIIIRCDEALKSSVLDIPQEILAKDRTRTVKGVVEAIGPDAFYDKPSAWAKVGDTVMFAVHAGWVYVEDKVTYRVINDEDLVGRFVDV